MLPQQGQVPNFRMRISGPITAFLILVLLTGGLLTLSSYLQTEPGDLAAKNRTALLLMTTILLSIFILIAGTHRWWYPHLWKHGNSQSKHRERIRRKNGQAGHRRHHRHRH